MPSMKQAVVTHLTDRAVSDCNRRNNLLTPARSCTSSKSSSLSPLPIAMLVNIPMSHIDTTHRGRGQRGTGSLSCQRATLIMALTILITITGSSCSIDSGYTNDQPPSEASGDYGHSHIKWTFGDDKIDRLQTYIEGLMSKDCRDIPGLSLSIVSDGRPAFTTGLGYADVEKGIRTTPGTLFGIASLSKAFTSTLLARLIQQNKGLSWDTKVWDILQDKYPFRDDYITRHVTIRDLLSHHTGIQRHDMLWLSGIPTQGDVLRKLKCMKTDKGFRGHATYNNILYALAGRLAEEIGGAAWEDLMTTELLEPLGMMDTTFLRDVHKGSTNLKAEQYVHFNGRTIPIGDPFYEGARAISPAIAVCSNARDMATWMEFQLSLGRSKAGHVIITSDMMEEMHKGHVSTSHMRKPSIEKNGKVLLSYDQYGLGWFVGYYKGYRILMHYGSYPGYYSMITLVPKMNFGIFTSINGGLEDSAFTINTYIHTNALDLAMIRRGAHSPNTAPDNSQCSPRKNYRLDCENRDNLSPRNLKRFTGIYNNAVFGNLTFSLEDGGVEVIEGEEFPKVDLVMTYNDLRYRAIAVSQVQHTEFCVETLDDGYKYSFPPYTISFRIDIGTDIIESVSVPSFHENDRFYKLPEDVSYVDWSRGNCGNTDSSCNKIEKLPAVSEAALSRVTNFIFVICVLISCL